jgi:hypothetical protein
MYPLALRPSLETQANYTVEWLLMLDEIGEAAFSEALRRAVHESEYFPTISKVRMCAGITTEQKDSAAADAAWLLVEDWIRRWHGVMFPVFKSGTVIEKAPKLPARIAYAVRVVGGIDAIANVTDKGAPFLRKEFGEAFERYEHSGRIGAEMQLAAPEVKRLMAGAVDDKAMQPPAKRVVAAPLSEEEVEQKKAEAVKAAERFKTA